MYLTHSLTGYNLLSLFHKRNIVCFRELDRLPGVYMRNAETSLNLKGKTYILGGYFILWSRAVILNQSDICSHELKFFDSKILIWLPWKTHQPEATPLKMAWMTLWWRTDELFTLTTEKSRKGTKKHKDFLLNTATQWMPGWRF